jgi:hypothetical protein
LSAELVRWSTKADWRSTATAGKWSANRLTSTACARGNRVGRRSRAEAAIEY